MPLQCPNGSTTYHTYTAADANLMGNIFACGYIYWSDGYDSVKAFIGAGSIGGPQWYLVIDSNNLEARWRIGPAFALTTIGLGNGIYPALNTWCWWYFTTDAAKRYSFGCETSFQGNLATRAATGGFAASTGVPGTTFNILKTAVFSYPQCALADVRVYQLGNNDIPSDAVINKMRLSRGAMIDLPGASLEVHLPLFGRPGSTTDDQAPIDATEKRVWVSAASSGTPPPHNWIDGPYPRNSKKKRIF